MNDSFDNIPIEELTNGQVIDQWTPSQDVQPMEIDQIGGADIVDTDEPMADAPEDIAQDIVPENPDVSLNDHVSNFVAITPGNKKFSKKWGVHFLEYHISTHDLQDVNPVDVPNTIFMILNYIFEFATTNARVIDKVRLCIDSESLQIPIWTPPMTKAELSVERWMEEVDKVLQSNKQIILNDDFVVRAQILQIDAGGCIHNVPEKIKSMLTKKRCILQVRNTKDNTCLARCFVLANAHIDHGDQSAEYKRLRDELNPQKKAAYKLLKDAGLPDREMTVADIASFEKVMPKRHIRVWSLEKANSIIYDNKNEKDPEINLLVHSNHFAIIKSMSGFFGHNYYCSKCKKGYWKKTSHRCAGTCPACFRQNCEENDDDVPVNCSDCGRTFRHQECFEFHLAPGKNVGRNLSRNQISICSKVRLCPNCSVFINTRSSGQPEHQCGEVYCTTCFTYVMPDDHKCFIKPLNFELEERKRHLQTRFLFFDFETYVNEEGILVPNLAVVQDDRGEEHIFPSSGRVGDDPTEQLCQFIFSEDHEGYIVMAHNFQSFDGIFILQWCLNNGIKVDVVMNGGKILQLRSPKYDITFRDSMAYVPTSLSKFPGVVGLPDVSKGTFPHHFNRPENWNRIVDYPSRADFDFAKKIGRDKEEFDRWYEQDKSSKGGKYNFNKEFVDYCSQDVTVLRECCLEFRKLFMEVSEGICPFTAAMTIAGVCSFYWRARCLKPKSIAILHRFQLPTNRLNSPKGLQWLSWIASTQAPNLRSSLTGREKKIGRFFVDGFDPEENRVYEFYGCYWHGCLKCFSETTVHPNRKVTMKIVNQETLAREEWIKSQGHEVTAIWEHEFKDMLKTDHELQQFVKELTFRTPLRPRDAFKGGRVNGFKLLHNVEPGEKIHYYDVTSEYPFINKNGKYPVGQHVVIRRDFKDISEYYGLVKCTLNPPRGLKIPVIPCTVDGKLYFPLCRTCAAIQQLTPCQHNREERALHGTWCTPEVMKALELGYTIEPNSIEEIWHYEETQVGLFADYINVFLKLKTEASGWPADAVTEQQKNDFIIDFLTHENILLTKDDVKKNPGLRALAKLCLNSMWGRLGMKDNKMQTEFLHDPSRFTEIILSGRYDVSAFELFNDDVMMIQYRTVDDFAEVNPTTNVVVAAFTTCLARLHLYKYMEKLGDQLLYCDTDSVIFSHKPGQYLPPLGNFLGDLTDELKPGQYITSFASLGPKCYGYATNTGETSVKIKGHTINGETKDKLNFSRMLELLSDRSVENIKYSNVLDRNKRKLTITQTDRKKKWRFTYDKRVIIDGEYRTVPYGF